MEKAICDKCGLIVVRGSPWHEVEWGANYADNPGKQFGGGCVRNGKRHVVFKKEDLFDMIYEKMVL